MQTRRCAYFFGYLLLARQKKVASYRAAPDILRYSYASGQDDTWLMGILLGI